MAAMKAANKASEEAQARRNSILAAADRLEAVISAVSSASHQLSAQIEQSGRGAMEQTARMTETSTAMDEMNSTVLEVARNAGKAAEVSAETRQRAEAGADVVRSAVSSIQDVQQQSVQLKQDMGVLENHARSIDHVTTISGETAEAMKQSLEAVAELTRQMEELGNLVAEMKRGQAESALRAIMPLPACEPWIIPRGNKRQVPRPQSASLPPFRRPGLISPMATYSADRAVR